MNLRRTKIKVPDNVKIAVVGDIHEHEQQFDELLSILKPSEKLYFVSVGDIYDRGSGIIAAESITQKIINLSELGIGFAVRGNHELKHIKNTKKINKYLEWWDNQPLCISFYFNNGTSLTVLHGGIKPTFTSNDLDSNVEIAYIRTLDENNEIIKIIRVREDGKNMLKPAKQGISWHEKYDGRFGYIAAGHDSQKDGKPKFYNYSCNLDSNCYNTGILSCQIFSEKGLDELVQVKGAALYVGRYN